MRVVLVLLATLITGVYARSEVIIYKFSTLERFVGHGVDQRRLVKGSIVIDLATHDLSIVGTSVRNKQKEMVVGFLPSVDIQSVTGAVGIVHTVISAVEKDRQESGVQTFTLTYARGANSMLQISSSAVVAWPRKMSFSGSGINLHRDARLVNEGSGITFARFLGFAPVP